MVNQKLLVYLSSNFYVRSFFSGQIVDTLLENFDLTLAVTSDLSLPEISKRIKVVKIEKGKLSESLFPKYLDASLIRNIYKSSSFRFRLQRFIFGDYPKPLGFSPKGLMRFIRAVFLSMPLIYGAICSLYKYSAIARSQILPMLVQEEFKIVICWCQSMEPAALETVLAARETSTKSILVFDNWDNLSSKAVLLEKPDFLICFGENSKRFAEKIHGVAPSSIFALGSARFDVYLDGKNRDLNSRREVLIIGSSIALEDKTILDFISKKLYELSRESSLRDFKFMYRPHPAPQGISINMSNWDYPNIEIDKYSLEILSGITTTWQDQKSLAIMLASKKLVIAAPTTFLLEALLSGCKVIVPALPVKGINTTIRKMLSELEHLKNLESLPNLLIVNHWEDFWKQIESALLERSKVVLGAQLGEEVTIAPGTFASRFLNTILTIIDSAGRKN